MVYSTFPNNYRRLTVCLAVYVLLQNVAAAYALHRFPDDPMSMSSHLSFYSWFASVLACLGVIGARKENATLVAIFANFLIIDVILCSVPRLLTLFFFPQIRGSICSEDSINARLQAMQATGLFGVMDNQAAAENQMMDQCMSVLLVLQVFAGVLVAGATFMQIVLALKVRAYSCVLQQRQDVTDAINTVSHHYTSSVGRRYMGYRDESEDSKLFDQKSDQKSELDV